MDQAQEYEASAKVAGAKCATAALEYLKLGWSALALCPPDHWAVGRTHGKECKSPGKVPIGVWKIFQSRLATEEELNAYWKSHPALNVGMALGPVSGLIGVDIDGTDGEAAIREASGGDLPPTLEFTSGAGRRLLYRIPAGIKVRPTHRAAGEKHSGYSLLGEGSQTVMPPSRHSNGKRYEWVTGRGPGEIVPAVAPHWLLDAMAAPPFIPDSQRHLDQSEIIPEGRRDRTLISMAGTMRNRGFSEAAIFAALTTENESRVVPPLEESDIRRISKSVAKYEPDAAAGMTIKFPTPSTNGHHEADQIGPFTYRASTVKPRKVDWLWPGRIPLGKLTTFAGLGGLGKTFVLCDLTARVSRGSLWPFCDGMRAPPGRVLFVSGEDDPEDTLVPRMIEMGADLDRVSFMHTERQDRFVLADIDTLNSCVDEIGSELRLVVIDPPTAFLGGVNDHNNAELRGVLSPLKSFASRGQLACIFNTHFTKGSTGAKVPAMMRVMASVAWVNAVRAAHAFCRDTEDSDKVVFVPMKMNLCKMGNGLAYTIRQTIDGRAKVEWLGTVDTTADEAVSGTARPRCVRAAMWLIERFRERLEWNSDVLFAAATQAGHSRSSMYEARDSLRLPDSRTDILTNGNRVCIWWVPDDWPKLCKASDIE